MVSRLLLLYAVIALNQNFVSIVVFAIAGDSPLVSAALVAKDAILLLLFVCVGMQFFADIAAGKRQPAPKIVSMTLIGTYAAYVIASAMGKSSSYLQDARLALILPLSIFLGLLASRRANTGKLVITLTNLALTVACACWLEYALFLAAGDWLWITLDIRGYKMFRDPLTPFLTGPGGLVPGAFYSFDLRLFGPETSFRRMVSLNFVDATICAQFLAFGFTVSLYRKKVFQTSFLLATCILTLGKGGILVCLFSTTAWAFSAISLNKQRLGALGKYLSFASIALVCAIMFSFAPSQSMRNHVSGFAGAIQAAIKQPLGRGLGTGGNRGLDRARSEGVTVDTSDSATHGRFGGESYIGSSLVQLGLASLVAPFLGLWLLRLRRPVSPASDGLRIAAAGTIMVSFLSESAMSYTSTLPWLTVAFAFTAAEIEITMQSKNLTLLQMQHSIEKV